MRIGMFVDCDMQRINGVVSSVSTAKKQLEALGHEIFLFVPGEAVGDGGAPAGTYLFRSSQVFFAPEQRLSYPLPLRHFAAMSALKLDVVHLHTPFSMGLFGLWHARKYRLPVVVTHHTRFEDTLHYLPVPGATYLRALAIYLMRRFDNAGDVVIAPSGSIKDLLIKQGVSKPITVLPTGIEPKMFRSGDRAATRAALGLSESAKVCITMGRIGKEKSLEFLIHAFAEVAARETEAILLVVGDGPERVHLEALVDQMALTPCVRFTGYIQRTELRHLLAAADVFVFGSVFETQGLVVIEAMAAGLPVVGVDAPGTRDAVLHEETGYLTPQETAPFAGRVCQIINHLALRQRLATAAVERAEQFLSANMATDLLAVYHRVLQRPTIQQDVLKLGA